MNRTSFTGKSLSTCVFAANEEETTLNLVDERHSPDIRERTTNVDGSMAVSGPASVINLASKRNRFVTPNGRAFADDSPPLAIEKETNQLEEQKGYQDIPDTTLDAVGDPFPTSRPISDAICDVHGSLDQDDSCVDEMNDSHLDRNQEPIQSCVAFLDEDQPAQHHMSIFEVHDVEEENSAIIQSQYNHVASHEREIEDEAAEPPEEQLNDTSDRQIISRFRKISKWQNLLSVLFVTGSARVSVASYTKFQIVLNTLLDIGFPKDDKLPAYSTVLRTLLPILKSWGFVQSEMHTAQLDTSKAGARRKPDDLNQLVRYQVVRPSAWSALDVSFSETWNVLRSTSNAAEADCNANAFEYIEKAPIVRNRQEVLQTMSVFAFPFDDKDRDDCEQEESFHSLEYNLQFRTMPQISETLLRVAEVSMESEGGMSSVTFRPLRSVLVRSTEPVSDLSSAPLTCVRKGDIPALFASRAGFWYAGDYCTILRVPTDAEEILVLVHHQAVPGRFDRRLELICIPFSVSNSRKTCVLDWTSSRKVLVTGMRLRGCSFETPHRTIPYNRKHRNVPSFGRLQNGMQYFIDHILLFSDGFTQYSFKQGSAGGIYCLSLNYPAHLRRSRDSVRVLGLTPPGVSTSEGLRALIPDLVKSATTGIITRNADGEDMLLFTDVVGYVCDYHEVSHLLDVVGATGRAPCHLCSVLRFNGPERSGSRYGNTTVANSADGCYARTNARVRAIRSSNISDEDLVFMGLSPERQAKEKASPLIRFHDALREAAKTAEIPITEFGDPVVNLLFDPYRSLLVAPDHLLAGIAINELNLLFKALPNTLRREQAEQSICHMLSSNGLLKESRIYNHQDKTLYSTSISKTFCVLLVAAPVFTELVDNLFCPQELSSSEHSFLRRIVSNMRAFQNLVARTYWYPKRHLDNPSVVKAFNENEGMNHLMSLQDSCIKYITECDLICRTSTTATKALDKPNLHRLLELYMHSIPAMGHVRHFSELIFECAHQPLKKSMANSDKRQSHLQAMKHIIADDWKMRLASALCDRGGISHISSLQSVLNLISGRQVKIFQLLQEIGDVENVLTDLVGNSLIKNVLGEPPIHMDRRHMTARWVLSDLDDNPKYQHQIRRLYHDYVLHTGNQVPTFYVTAKRLKTWRSGKSQVSSHSRDLDKLSRGMAIQCLVLDDISMLIQQYTTRGDNNESRPFVSYFVIEQLFGIRSDFVYGAVRRCSVLEGTKLRLHNPKPLQLLEMTDNVRRICVAHCCHSDPKLRCLGRETKQVRCTASLLNGHLFRFYSRELGYPPRMA